jgi:ornithine cyclodeaminase
VCIHSRSEASAHVLASHAIDLGLQARVVGDPDAALAECPLVVTCTPAAGIVLRGRPRDDAFIAAVGAFTPAMIELAPELTLHCARHGRIVVDTREADHEAGDLLQAGLDVAGLPSLRDLDPAAPRAQGPVLFKSCGWAGWDLAAARCALRTPPAPQ